MASVGAIKHGAEPIFADIKNGFIDQKILKKKS